MEVDYIDEENGPASQNIKNYNLDYVIGSVHFIPDQKGTYHDIDGSSERFKRHLAEFFHNDLDYVVKTFWRQTASMLKAGGLDIVGHIDKIALNASSVNPEIEKNPYYKKLAEETINLAIDQGIKIEINTKHWEKSGRMFPHPRYWSQIKAACGELIINSDAHSVDMIETGMEAAKNLLNMTDYA